MIPLTQAIVPLLFQQVRDILGEDYKVVSVIGDGALTGGMAYEALNNAARMKKNFIIILNDNKMSISENVGGMSRYLGGLRTGAGYNDLKKNVADTLERIPVVGGRMIDKIKRTKNSIKQLFIPGMLFENMGITYLGRTQYTCTVQGIKRSPETGSCSTGPCPYKKRKRL